MPSWDGPGDGVRWRVFLSHTSELRKFPEGKSYVAEAERAISAAGHVIVDMAGFPATDHPAAQLCAERVRGCDVYVGVLGTRYGSPVRDKPEVSYTELEFDTATAAGLPRLVFLLDTAAADVGIPLAELIDNKFGARQEEFRRRVQASGLATQYFASPAALGQLVERSLRDLAETRQGRDQPPVKTVLRVWNIPARNPGFTGRDDLLDTVREQLLAGGKTVVYALHGMGGVGKTQLAAEYAHRFAMAYDLAWWVNSEQAGLIGDQFAALGLALGCVQAGAEIEVVRAKVLAELRERARWLLVFDNAENPAEVTPWLPGGGGHVLITTRRRGWAEVARQVEVDVLARPESVTLLRNRVDGLTEADADRLADELGDLPLAVAQAAGFMAETSMAAAEYLGLLRTRAGQLLSHGSPVSYRQSLAAVTQLIADRLADDDLPAAQLASICAFLASEPISEDLFTSAPDELPGELAAQATDPLGWRQTLSHLVRHSLARVDDRGLQMHRLTQAILRDRLTAAQATATRECAEAILAASNPGDADNPATWPRWARLVPHLLAADLTAAESHRLRQLACDACHYLMARGDTRIAYQLASDLRQQWRVRLGDDHEHTLKIARCLAWALVARGRYAKARDLDQDILDRRRRILGEDHPDTLYAATFLAADLRHLGEMQAARDLAQDTWDRSRRVLGEDHPDTLYATNSLINALRKLGDVQAARDLAQDTWDRSRRVLGEDHPDTLYAANILANALRELGDVQSAHDLDRDILDRRRRVLGEDHPMTLGTASHLATDLRELGEVQSARDLDRDILDRRRRVLGEDHPDTLSSASNLALDLGALGEGG